MNHQLGVNIMQQFDNDLSMLVNNCITSMDFKEKKELQAELEALVKQRGEALAYIKQELSK
tara:strand:+ start:5644 stop:5826 length:183 start_codon:yes stop_codon:yes gene_type:complete